MLIALKKDHDVTVYNLGHKAVLLLRSMRTYMDMHAVLELGDVEVNKTLSDCVAVLEAGNEVYYLIDNIDAALENDMMTKLQPVKDLLDNIMKDYPQASYNDVCNWLSQ